MSSLSELELQSIERFLETDWVTLPPKEDKIADYRKMAKELRDARTELKKYLSLCDEETIVGGIRNLAQAFYSWKGIAKSLEKELGKSESELAEEDILMARVPNPVTEWEG